MIARAVLFWRRRCFLEAVDRLTRHEACLDRQETKRFDLSGWEQRRCYEHDAGSTLVMALRRPFDGCSGARLTLGS